jgi:hypothetical protein
MAKTIQRSNMVQTDSRGKVLRAPKDNSAEVARNFRWWELDEKDIAGAVQATLRFIQMHQSSRIEQLTVSTRLYGNTNAYNLLGAAIARASSVNSNPMSSRVSFNLCNSVTDTLVAKMAKNKVIPTFITNGGDWSMQKKAKQLTKFSQGVDYEHHIHDLTINQFRDGSVWGDGFLHIFEKDDRLAIERELPHNLWVDQVEALVGPPRSLYRTLILDKSMALVLFPELEEEIITSAHPSYQEIGGQGTSADLIEVVEAWHLRSGKGKKDGMHAVCIGEGSIPEAWDKDYFPFAHFCYSGSARLLGWYGQGACERLQNLQGEINRNMMTIQKALWMGATAKVFLENSSKVVSQHVNNDVMPIIHYSGVAPIFYTPPLVQPEIYQWVESLIEKGYRQEGVSPLEAASVKPMGVDSGKALRAMTDIADQRFEFQSQQMEANTLEVHRQAINVIKDIAKRKKGSYEVTFPQTNFVETIDWASINLNEDQYVLKAFPTSGLADDLTGRLSDVQELAQAGMISPRTAQRMMQMPDVEMLDKLTSAAEDRLHQIFEKILEDGEWTAPEENFDLVLANQLLLQYYNYAQFMNAPTDRINMLLEWKAIAKQIMDEAAQEAQNQAAQQQAAAQAAAAPQQPQPAAMPEPTPTSNLVPNVAQAA